MKEDHRRSAEEQPLKEVIEKFLKAYAWDGKMKEMDLVAAWPELMGIAVANRTKEIRIQNKKLFLTIDSSVVVVTDNVTVWPTWLVKLIVSGFHVATLFRAHNSRLPLGTVTPLIAIWAVS